MGNAEKVLFDKQHDKILSTSSKANFPGTVGQIIYSQKM